MENLGLDLVRKSSVSWTEDEVSTEVTEQSTLSCSPLRETRTGRSWERGEAFTPELSAFLKCLTLNRNVWIFLWAKVCCYSETLSAKPSVQRLWTFNILQVIFFFVVALSRALLLNCNNVLSIAKLNCVISFHALED